MIDNIERAVIIFCLSMLLSACGFLSNGNETQVPAGLQNQSGSPAETATPTPVMPPELKGDIAIQELMLTSHNRWHTLHIIYTVNQYPGAGATAEADQQIVQIWIKQPGEFKVVVSEPKGGPQTGTVSDGKNIVDSSGQQQVLPPSALEPFNPPNTPSDTVYTHPLAGYLGTPVSDLVFPAGLAQRGGEYTQTGKEIVADRPAYVVEWSREPGKLIDRFWVDEQTGIILRQQNYGKANNTSPVSDAQATFVEIDSELPADTFSLAGAPAKTPGTPAAEPASAWVTVKTEVSLLNVRSLPDMSAPILTTMQSGEHAAVLSKTPAGDWWQVSVKGMTGWVFAALVDFSGDAAAVPVSPR